MPSKKSKKEVIEYDGRRGDCGSNGMWYSLAEATFHSAGSVEWWRSKLIDPVQHANGPKDRPVWMFERGDMYLGEWKEDGPKGYPVEHGYGITHYFKDEKDDKGFKGAKSRF